MKAAVTLLVTSAAIVAGNVFVHASVKTMSCRGPTKSYLVHFDEQSQKLAVDAAGDSTNYSVHSVSSSCGETVLQGNTTLNGPSYQAFISGRKRIEFYRGKQRVQIDLCE